MNYGETLQAVALNHVITKLGYQCITASYENQKVDFEGWFKRNIRKYGIRCAKYELFRRKNIRYPIMRSNEREKFEKLLLNADAVVCGSDCVWYEKDYNSIFFLYFPKINIPKISYAPSLRDDTITDSMYFRKVKKWLNDFSYLSTREIAGSKIISELSHRYVETVLDPTLLLNQKEWNKMSASRLIREPYILIYIIGKTKCMKDIISEVESFYKGRKLIWITMENNDGYYSGEALNNIGPAEFLSLVRYADVVVTDSFHGSAFSIIYEKQFYVIKRIVGDNDIYDHDCRIKNILSICNIHNYFSYDSILTFDASKIDYALVNKILLTERSKSMKFLKKALNVIK